MMNFKQYLKEQSAKDFATIAHAKQKRAGGLPYIVHPTAVAKSVETFKIKSKNIMTMKNFMIL